MAAFQWPIGKIECINSALSACGDNLVAVADDGSEEWNAASPAYERALAVVTESASWSWVTKVETLQPAGNTPADDRFDTAYNLPDDLVHLILVRVGDRPTIWDLQDDQLVVNAQGGPPPPSPPTTPAVVAIKGIFSTKSDLVNGTPTVVVALQHFVMAAIYRGLHKDTAEAGRMFALANQILEAAKSRHDMQKPKRAMFISRTLRARRIRRPDPPYPSGGDNGPWR
jgi:hypothetical protein